ncbi:16S rRNA (cytosine(1402)-N(4))-methyltransferase RsmH [bacterium]|nr:16S rRNA (cytosine(1402)-N(4))-methyltransferase RsmH [bacterium]MCP5461772.1 16S rRNA (cytosine(1402)-N(4))-methyltransferase RsmH [bacterium]
MDNERHISVLEKEVVQYICERLPESPVILDCTLGAGGHTAAIIEQIAPLNGSVIAIDIDKETLHETQRQLKKYSENITFVNRNFKESKQILQELGVEKVNGIILDLGVSSMQVDNPERGFSFTESGPLDMRMGESVSVTAGDIVNFKSEEELYTIFRDYGEERWSRRIALRIVEARQKQPLTTTGELEEIVFRAIPAKFRRHQRIHPATRVFQALRIAANDELGALENILHDVPDMLHAKGRVAVISFHSLEDRIAKHVFRQQKRDGLMEVITKKPLVPTDEEINKNRRARSAKLRIAERSEPHKKEPLQ